MKKIIIFLGAPGCGKGTQAKKLAAKFGYGHISTGDLLRALENDPQGESDDKQKLIEMKAGKLVSDSLIYKLAFREIEKYLAQGKGVVLDGAIRNLAQAQEYQKFFESKNLASEVTAVEIALTDEESFNRLTKRRVCSACGEIIPYLPTTKDLKACSKCGGDLKVRNDDDPEVIKKRIVEQGNTALKPILDYYDGLGVLQRVDGMGMIDDVEDEIVKLLNC
ncbi:MAG: nucleoside monophosphate kinase [Candidatus Magasanikbacteria bacterium]